ncbi:hypothetical protein C5B96_09700 [Subtercola sp. Z020]|uniref:hypothetical protein n=1 Tax=Subtercola sp. Z020 TaxID=2080582 RepID=UPI000CE79B87|nr:hypothetical protein [Subtercola sp. Z020]PPF82218.1 hypothetical protein C5B96_09700 [Subtercola sp. Z020]
MLIVIIAVGFIAFIAVLLTKRSTALVVAVTAGAISAVLVPSFGPAPDLKAAALVVTIVPLTLAILRNGSALLRQRLQLPLILYFIYSSIMATVNASGPATVLALATGLSLLLLVLCNNLITDQKIAMLARLMVVVVVFQFFLGFNEAVLGNPALWPRPDGSDRILSRVNHFAEFLPGRVLGSTAGPIPYGTLAAIGLMASLWIAVEQRKRVYWFAVVAAAGALLFSGTRSALLAVILAIIAWILVRSRVSRPLIVLFGVLGAFIFAASVNVVALFGFSDFADSTSYVHRSGVIGSVGSLLTQQPMFNVLFGNGALANTLLTNGVIGSADSVPVYDNQFVREIAVSGILGFGLLVIAIVVGLKRGDMLSRLCLGILVLMFFSFDALTWRAVAIVFAMVCSGPVGGTRLTKSSLAEPEQVELPGSSPPPTRGSGRGTESVSTRASARPRH